MCHSLQQQQQSKIMNSRVSINLKGIEPENRRDMSDPDNWYNLQILLELGDREYAVATLTQGLRSCGKSSLPITIQTARSI